MGKEQTGASEVTEQGLPKLVNSDKPKFFGLWNESMNTLDAYMKSNNESIESWSGRTRQNAVDVANLKNDVNKLSLFPVNAFEVTLDSVKTETIGTIDETTNKFLLSIYLFDYAHTVLSFTKRILYKSNIPLENFKVGDYLRYDIITAQPPDDNVILVQLTPLSLGNVVHATVVKQNIK